MAVRPSGSFAALALACPLVLSAACAGDQPRLGLAFDPSDCRDGEIVEVAVEVHSVIDLYGAALDVVYPPSVFEYRGAEIGPWFQGDTTAFLGASLEDGAEGRLVLGVSRAGRVAGATGSGTLATARFEQVCGACGAATFDAEGVTLRNSMLQDIVIPSTR